MKSELSCVDSDSHERLVEGKPEFDEKKMRKLIKKDKFLNFFYQDNFAKGSSGEQNIGLEAMFHTFVLDSANGKTYMKMYKSISEEKSPIEEEWQGYKPNMPVQVVGVKNGRITGNGSGVEVFKNLKDAQKKYSDLDPEENTMRFTWVTRGEVNGKDAGRFETWKAYKMYSMEETEKSLKPRLDEKFNARILPANLEDLEMKTLIVAIGSTVIGLLDRIKKNTGSNANPVSLQVIKGGDAIKSALKKNLDLKGKEALVAFFKETNKHFDASAPVISSIVRKYKLKSDRYSGNVFVEQETKLRDLVKQYLTRLMEKADVNIPDNVVDLQDRLEQKKKDVEWWQAKLNKSRKNSLIAIRSMHLQQAKKDVKDLEKALKKAQKNESTEEPIEEAKKSKMIPMEKYGAAFMVDNGTLMSVAMLRDGSFETWDGDLDWGEVTAPHDQKFLDDINKAFKTKFKMDDFAGR
tara:strand:- start:26926 stop:28317 length:1392 start_codon:yes stop_codon:yes gene_type:complete